MSEWIIIEEGCKLPNPCESVLVSIVTDWSYGKGTDVCYEVDYAQFQDDGSGYLDTILPGVGFDTNNDWDEGQPIKVVAWMPLPEPMRVDARYLLLKGRKTQ